MADPIIARDLTPGQQSLLYASLITVLAQDIARARGLLRLDQYLVTLPLEEQRAMRQAARFAIRPESIVHTAQMYLRRNLAPRLYGGATFDKLTLVERHLIAETAVVVWETLMDVLAVRTPDIEAWEADCLMFEGAYDPAALLRRTTDGVQ